MMGEQSNIEIYKAKQREISDKRIITVIQEKGYFESIMELSKELPDMSYGGVQTAINRLVKDEKIFAKQFHDKENGVAKKMIFASKSTMNNFFKDDESVDGKVSIPEFFSTLYKLFFTIAYEDDESLKEIVQNSGITLPQLGRAIIDILNEFLGVDLKTLGDLQREAEEYIKGDE